MKNPDAQNVEVKLRRTGFSQVYMEPYGSPVYLAKHH